MGRDLGALRQRIGSGLLAFPVTCFTQDGMLDEATYRAYLATSLEHGAAGLFAPGGTGEFFSLTLEEATRVTRIAVEEAAGRVPVIGGTGYGTSLAISFAKAAQAAGADAVLVLPPYLVHTEQEGLFRHVDAICRSIGIGVIIYNRDNSLYSAETVTRLADRHPNLIGFKDGHGAVEQLVRVRQVVGDRLAWIGGMPTAEVFAVPYLAAGFTTYSSGIYNFAPRTAQHFFRAVRAGDQPTIDRMMKTFLLPYISLRNRRNGYAVSIVKAGMRVVGRPAGPVRSPLVDLDDAEHDELRRILVEVIDSDMG